MPPCNESGWAGLTRGLLASEECHGASGGISGESISPQVFQFLGQRLRRKGHKRKSEDLHVNISVSTVNTEYLVSQLKS